MLPRFREPGRILAQVNDWSLYLLRTGSGALYTGIARDVDRRVAEHRAGAPKGAKALRGRGPLEVVYRCEVGERGLALQIESWIKRRSKAEKETLVAQAPGRKALLERLP